MLSNIDNLSLEKLNEKINAYDGQNEIPAPVASVSATAILFQQVETSVQIEVVSLPTNMRKSLE